MAKRFRFELGFLGMVFVFLLLVCLFFWMFVLGVWFGQRLVGKGASPVAEKTLKEKVPEEVPAEEVSPPPVALPGNLTASPQAAPPEAPKEVTPQKVPPEEARVVSPPKSSASSEKTKKPVPQPREYYVLQVASFRDRAEAERYARAFRDRGYAAEVVTVNLPGKGTWHRIYVGRFETQAEAEKAYRELKARKLVKTAYIKKVSR
ncbi:hypothetical protein FVE67_07590 [Thermosulfurimonas marina]|uniref:SPOR domain-containing protein n=1 Tax=Thermosulfurimonas marina TaxID=2047767 RepID=A0A6H1WU36_9BACT|nr:SPOR domain-containing protein [Thermosulfurimonas marina]QJA06664.1 hypothetical protein FVE67_07590 [Thermosulfurimonas marina]